MALRSGATSAMCPAVLRGEGRRRRTTRSYPPDRPWCSAGASAEAKSNTLAAGHLRMADKMRRRVAVPPKTATEATRTEAGGAAKYVTGRSENPDIKCLPAWRVVCRCLPERDRWPRSGFGT
jgi:hypothetical protein